VSEQLQRAGADVNLGVEATPADLLALQPDLLVAYAGPTMRFPAWQWGPGLQIVSIGDALAPRTLLDAVAEGARVRAGVDEVCRPTP
jgi:hypothetical protein